MEVVGRHALFFDDDANANFVNSKEALVEWNSLFIDRYDVRHLLTSPPASFKRLRQASGSSPLPDSHLESELDVERYADLPSSTSSDQELTDMSADGETINTSGYHAVTFSYGNNADTAEQKNDDINSEANGFCPPFPVPENLAHSLPSCEKVHQIIARTALFVSQHGGQSEIVLRVKQGDNPTFGFLMPHHHLHPYFRYLVDHPAILNASSDGNSQKRNNTGNRSESPETGGALSLLGSMYGSVEDEDVVPENAKEPAPSNDLSSVEISNAGDLTCQHQLKASKLLRSSKEKASILIKSGVISSAKSKCADNGKEDALGSKSADVKNSKLSTGSSTNGELLVIEPPSDIKRLVDRIVEIILKNGQGFEALLIEQDKNQGRFPFLLSSNRYHPYYKNMLRMAQKSRAIAKSFGTDKDAENKTAQSKQIEESADDRKEKFKMVINKTKKEMQEQPSKEPQQPPVMISADAAAAILQAATRGIKKPELDIFSKNQGSKDGPSSSESELSKEQKLKAERLKRAKMFAATIKSKEKPRALSAETSHEVKKMDEKASVSKRHYRSKNEDEEGELSEEENERHSRKKHRSHHSSRHHRDDSKERHKHRRRHHHKHESSSDEEYGRYKHKRRSSQKDDHGDDKRKKHTKRSNTEERDLEEGEISAKSSDQSLSSVINDANKEKSLERASSEQPQVTVVPDDLRAKIRAMLLATL